MAVSNAGTVIRCNGTTDVLADGIDIVGILCSAASQTITTTGTGVVLFTSPAAGFFKVELKVKDSVTVGAGASQVVTLYSRTE